MTAVKPPESVPPLTSMPPGGHGHVVPRPDGVKARCGGPALCSVCAFEAVAARQPVTAVSPERPPVCVDDRCPRCTEAGKGAYRMVGRCRNCGLSPVLGLHSVSHEATLSDCPVCGTRNVSWDRLATPDEVPAGSEEAP